MTSERRLIRIAAGLTYESRQAFEHHSDDEREYWVQASTTDDPECWGNMRLEILQTINVPGYGVAVLYRRGLRKPDQEAPNMGGRKLMSAANMRRVIRKNDMQILWPKKEKPHE